MTIALWALAAAVAGEPTIEHERYTLDNGLEVVLARDTTTPLVHVELWYHVGSKDERKGLTGFAHLFEHLMFQGSANSPGEYFKPIQEVGGNINGTTNTDRTNYFETMPSRHLPLALFMESDRLGNLLPVLDQAALSNQQDVVRNERRQRIENPPYGDAWMLVGAALYPEGHPYHHPVIGSHEDLENATLDDVHAFFRTWYRPNNASLVISGDFEVDTAKRLVAEQFGWIAGGPDPERLIAAPVSLSENVVLRKTDDVPDKKLWLAWHAPPFFGEGDAELDIAASVLCGGKDSRLHERLVTTDRVARSVDCFQASGELTSRFVIAATAAGDHTTDDLVNAIDNELAAFLDERPPTADEVAPAVTQFEVGFYSRIQTVRGRAGMLSRYLHYTGRTDYIGDDLARYLAIEPAGVARWVGTVTGAPRVELHYTPEDGT